MRSSDRGAHPREYVSVRQQFRFATGNRYVSSATSHVGSDKIIPDSVGSCFGTGAQAELVEDVADVGCDGPLADE
jgi:hypothetical protein